MLDKKPTYEELEQILKAREEELNKKEVELNNLKSGKSIENLSVFNDLFTENHAIMLIIELETGKIVNANREACNFYGYSYNELIEMKINQINTLSDEQIKQKLNNAKMHIQNRFIFKHKLKTGELKEVEVNSSKIILQNKEFLLSIILDITERRKLQEDFHEVQQWLKATVDQSNDAITVAELNGRYVMVNHSFCNMTGYTEDELLNMKVTDLLPENTSLILFTQVSQKGISGIRELELQRKNGTKFWTIISGSLLEIGGKRYVQGIVKDITESKQAEIEINKNKLFIEKILQTSPNLIYIYDIYEKRNVYSNREVVDFLGYTPEQIKEFGSKLFDNILHPDDAINVANHHNKFSTINYGDILEVEYRMKHVNGEWHWLKSRDVLFIKNDQNINLQILGTAEDITDRKNTELEIIKAKEEAQENEQRLKLAINSGQLGIWDWNVKDNILNWDDRMFELYGINRDTFSNNFDAWTNGLHPEDKQKELIESNAALNAEKEYNTTFRVIHPNGNILWIKADGIVIRDSYNNPIRMIGINRDVSDIKLAEQELIKAKEKAEAEEILKSKMVTNIGDVIVIIDQNGNNRYKSPNSEKLFGWNDADLIGKSAFNNVHPDDLEHGKEFFNNLLRETNKTGSTEIRYKHKDGTYSWIQFTGINLLNDSVINGILGNYHNISDRKKLKKN